MVVTGVGLASPLGRSPEELWRRLLAGESAVRPWADLAAEGYRATAAARIDDVPGSPLRRGRTLALDAARQAIAAAGPTLARESGVYVGSTLGESAAFEQMGAGEPLDLQGYTVTSFARAVRDAMRLRGPACALATACAAGNQALGAALRAVRHGRVPAAIAGGVEPFSRLALVGFSRSRAMAQTACRPFDRDRSGMVLGEGAAFVVLERAEDARRRGARALCEVAACGTSCDAYHPTAPRPDGDGMLRAMRAALDQAGSSPGDVDWVNAHGSGTRASDAAEARALHALFGERLPAVSGSKGALGHALGAASALEIAICVEGLRAQVVPPTAGHGVEDPDCGIACTTAPRPARLRAVLSNAFAFGGLNTSVLLRSAEA